MMPADTPENVTAYARAFKRSTGAPLIVPRGLAARMRGIGVDTAALEEEGAIVVEKPIPLAGRGWWTTRR